jgi:hypothetical protein
MNFFDAIKLSFQNEYPYGSKLHFKSENEIEGTPNPHYIYFILKALERGMANERITCLVFPKKGLAAHAAWATLATDTLARKVLPNNVEASSKENLSELKVNDLVSTYPGDKIFVWGGEIINEGKHYFSFKVLGRNGDQVCLPVSSFSALRIRKYPGNKPPAKQVGKLGDLRNEPENSGLDIIMPIKSYGNKGLIGVCACLISDKSTTSEFTSQVQISLKPDGPFTTIKESILDKDATAQSPEQCTCLYSTNLDEALETLRSSKNLPLGQKTPLIIDGLTLIRDYTYIQELRFSEADEQRPIVIVAEYSEKPQIERFKDAFDYWELHNTEIQNA